MQCPLCSIATVWCTVWPTNLREVSLLLRPSPCWKHQLVLPKVGAVVLASLWALWQLRGPSCPAPVRCAVTPVSGGWHHNARLVAAGGYTANIILITRVASEGTLGTLHWPECARNEEHCRLQCIHYTVVLTLARRSHNCGYTTPTPPTPSWS